MKKWSAGVGLAALLAAGSLLPATAGAQDPAPVVPPAPLPAGVVSPGVSIAGVAVGGLSRADARATVIAQHVAPRRARLVVTFRGRNLVIPPVTAGYTAAVDYAVKVAMLYGRSHALPATGTIDVPLRERVNVKRLRAIIAQRARVHGLPARDAALSFRGVTPVVRKARVGLTVNVPAATARIRRAILARDRARYPLPAKRVIPAVTSVGPAVIVERDKFRVTLWRAGRRTTFPIAVGTSAHPTPTGNFRIVSKQKNPTWFPPNSPWAAGLGPVPPGVDNPLGTRWMGTSAPAIGLHGTPIPSSIGTRASHGCIRMHIRDAERLYEMIEIGTPVIIR
jgi:lipoprotein-anchoring transpeptidase ErfK/SrfK